MRIEHKGSAIVYREETNQWVVGWHNFGSLKNAKAYIDKLEREGRAKIKQERVFRINGKRIQFGTLSRLDVKDHNAIWVKIDGEARAEKFTNTLHNPWYFWDEESERVANEIIPIRETIGRLNTEAYELGKKLLEVRAYDLRRALETAAAREVRAEDETLKTE